MNRERQLVVDTLATVANGAALRGVITPRDHKNLHAGMTKLVVQEEESIKRMQPHREKPATSSNINKAQRVVTTLNDALEHLEQGDIHNLASSLTSLEGIASPRTREPTFEDVIEELEVWPGDETPVPRSSSKTGMHEQSYSLYKEYHREQEEKAKLKDPEFHDWLQARGHSSEYEYVHASSHSIHNTGHSNRPEDY